MTVEKCAGCGDCNESCDREPLDNRLDVDNPEKMKKVDEASRILATHLFNMGAARIEEDINIFETPDVFRMTIERVLAIDGNDNAILSACCDCYKRSNGAGGRYCSDGLWDYRGKKMPDTGRHMNKKCENRYEIEEA